MEERDQKEGMAYKKCSINYPKYVENSAKKFEKFEKFRLT